MGPMTSVDPARSNQTRGAHTDSGVGRKASAGESKPKPFHLKGHRRPVEHELSMEQLPFEGHIPPELDGLYLRNGPNPKSGSSPHWFLGDGMLHGIRLRDGKADWYRNRWVRTKSFTDPAARLVADDGTVDYTVGVSNTHVVAHAGRILALVESSFPCEVDGDLATVGPYDFAGRLNSAMTAHPKICPLTGEMHFFGYGFAPPYLTYHRVDASGRLIQTEVIDVPGPTMMHDFSITENYVLFMDLPVVFDLELALAGGMPYRWNEDYGARIGVMPRGGSGDEARWFDVDPCYVFHPANSFEVAANGDGSGDAAGRIMFDVARYESMWKEGPNDFSSEGGFHRWEIDLDAGSVVEHPMDDLPFDFPRVADHLVGLPNKYVYGAVFGSELTASSEGLIRYDVESGASQRLLLDGKEVAEPVPVIGGDGAEDEGWLLTYVYDPAEDGSELWILDASELEAGPVGRIPMPQRVPMGFHGSWLPAGSWPES